MNDKADKVKSKSKTKLKNEVRNKVTEMFEKTLDFCQVACSTDRFKPLRSKILREGNNCIRVLEKVIDDNYEVIYIPVSEDVIEVKTKR